jgi:hypothetical protein
MTGTPTTRHLPPYRPRATLHSVAPLVCVPLHVALQKAATALAPNSISHQFPSTPPPPHTHHRPLTTLQSVDLEAEQADSQELLLHFCIGSKHCEESD